MSHSLCVMGVYDEVKMTVPMIVRYVHSDKKEKRNSFAKEHHDNTCKAGKGGSIIFSDVPPMPPLDLKEDHPVINYWVRDDFISTE
jgi:hypothetical protein